MNLALILTRSVILYKNIEEFKATAGEMVFYFMHENEESKEDIVVACLIEKYQDDAI